MFRASILSRQFHTSRSVWRTGPLTPLTSEKLSSLRRSNKFKQLEQRDIDFFRSVLPANNVIHDAESDPAKSSMTPYNADFFNLHRGASSLCLFPTATEQVSEILKYCNKEMLAVVPQGGNTGVSGGANPVFDEIIINTSKMNQIRSFNDISGVAVVDAGVILESLDNFLEPHGYTVPLDLGAKGSCQLGGNVSTNAGGLRLMRFGNLHGNVLGLEVVLPDGTILDNLSTLRKDNTGYDLKQLFIGAEGTLGLVTGVSLLTPRRPSSVNLAMLALDSFDDIQKAFVMAKEDLSEILSAFEFWDDASMNLVKKVTLPDATYPIEAKSKFYALLETQGSRQEHDQEKLDAYLSRVMEADVAHDGVIAQDAKQIQALWQWRETIPEAIVKSGTAMTYDVSMDVKLLYKMVEDAKKHYNDRGLLGDGNVYYNFLGFGHVGDGNLHIMANIKGFDYKVQKDMDRFVYDWAIKHKGSITAEHGVGVAKVGYMEECKSEPQLRLMRAIKHALDPRGIMNPYKVVPGVLEDV
ncbi:d-lactate dehydrogenase 2 [Lichtheimia corymbifera JMRC:FSU:9682]|uniref:D-lactate dehydrogenase 2 n=1 Tax=Lichtheimia corymbifera JMRC:FSU:9682 TaxID=1263082 RepID=A0A068SDJ3_9FUNG|nr:d-lactate dehydrogenase 2 [Lichtheimia corymbifera JMRC:FSU:9682]